MITQTLNQKISHLKKHLGALPTKDQRALAALTVFLSGVILHQGVWMPIKQWSNQQKNGYQQQIAEYQWVKDNIHRAEEMVTVKRFTEADLSSIVSSEARAAGLVISRVQPGRQGVSVWMEKTPYQNFLKYVVALETGHNVKVKQMRVNRQDEEGLVKGYLQLIQ